MLKDAEIPVETSPPVLPSDKDKDLPTEVKVPEKATEEPVPATELPPKPAKEPEANVVPAEAKVVKLPPLPIALPAKDLPLEKDLLAEAKVPEKAAEAPVPATELPPKPAKEPEAIVVPAEAKVVKLPPLPPALPIALPAKDLPLEKDLPTEVKVPEKATEEPAPATELPPKPAKEPEATVVPAEAEVVKLPPLPPALPISTKKESPLLAEASLTELQSVPLPPMLPQAEAKTPPMPELPGATPPGPGLDLPEALEAESSGSHAPRPVAFPKVEMMSKTPQPLLSRARRQGKMQAAARAREGERAKLQPAEKHAAPRQLAEAATEIETPDVAEAPEFEAEPLPPTRRSLLSRVLFVLLVCGSFTGLAYYTYFQWRETQVIGVVVLPKEGGYAIQEVAIVQDFSTEALRTAADLYYERAPLVREIQEKQQIVSRVQADLAGRQERIKLLREQIDTAHKDIDAVIRDAREASKKVWTDEGAKLDREYDERMSAFKNAVENRARELNLPYDPATDIQSPEVWVNAFRLSLYDAPASVNGAEQRIWAESQLNAWKAYNKEWEDRVTKLKAEVERIQTAPKERIDEINRRIATLNARVDETTTEIEPLQRELDLNQKSLDLILAEERSLDNEYYGRILKAPGVRHHTFDFDAATGEFRWRNIQKTPFRPGIYTLWVRVIRDNIEYWSLVNIPIYPYVKTVVVIQPTALVPVVEILRRGTTQAAIEAAASPSPGEPGGGG
jgi:peptidoglycan hydrolase CwlO-like protein